MTNTTNEARMNATARRIAKLAAKERPRYGAHVAEWMVQTAAKRMEAEAKRLAGR